MKYPLHKQIHARVQPFPVVCPRVLAILGNASFGIGLYPLKSKPKKWLCHLLLKITYRWKKQHLLAFPGRDKSTGFTLLEHKQKKNNVFLLSRSSESSSCRIKVATSFGSSQFADSNWAIRNVVSNFPTNMATSRRKV